MKRILILTLFILAQVTVFGQLLEFGTGASFTKFKGEVYSEQHKSYFQVADPVQLAFNATVSGNIPLKYLKKEVVLGVNPSGALSLFYSTIALDVPVFATLKLGSGSSEKSNSVLGLGVGVGGQFSFFSTALNPNFAPVNYTGVMVVPTVMGEASITFNDFNMYQVRLEFTPVPARKINKDFIGEISQINIRLIRAFL